MLLDKHFLFVTVIFNYVSQFKSQIFLNKMHRNIKITLKKESDLYICTKNKFILRNIRLWKVNII